MMDDAAVCTIRNGGKDVSLVYYDYKKMEYCIMSIPVNVDHDECYSFCWAMAVKKGSSIKVIDISSRVYEA